MAKAKNLDELQIDFLKKNLLNLSWKELSNKIGVGEGCLKRWANILNLKKNNKKPKSYSIYLGKRNLKLIREGKFNSFKKGELNILKNPIIFKKYKENQKKAYSSGKVKLPKTAFSKSYNPSYWEKTKKINSLKWSGKNNPSCNPDIVNKKMISSIEKKIMGFLSELKIFYIPHLFITFIKSKYPCDIFIPSKNLVIECDGDAFHFNPNKYNKDSKIFKNGMTAEERWKLDGLRTSELIEKGYKVLRLWENEIRVMKLEDFQERINLK